MNRIRIIKIIFELSGYLSFLIAAGFEFLHHIKSEEELVAIKAKYLNRWVKLDKSPLKALPELSINRLLKDISRIFDISEKYYKKHEWVLYSSLILMTDLPPFTVPQARLISQLSFV